jgi:hypothetical protein
MCIYTGLFQMSWTLSEMYYAVTKDMQYAPNCSATLNPPSILWLLKFVHISPARGHRSLNNKILEVFSSLWITLCMCTVHTLVLSCNTKRYLSLGSQLWFRCSADPFPRFMLLCRLHLSVYLTVLPPRCVCVCVCVCVSRLVSETDVFLITFSFCELLLSKLYRKSCPAVPHAVCVPNRTALVAGLPLFLVKGTSHPHCIFVVSFGLDVKINGTEYVACLEAKLSNVSIMYLTAFCCDTAYLCRQTSMFRRDLPLP